MTTYGPGVRSAAVDMFERGLSPLGRRPQTRSFPELRETMGADVPLGWTGGPARHGMQEVVRLGHQGGRRERRGRLGAVEARRHELGRLIVGRARLLFTEDHGERNPTQIVRLRPQPQRQGPTAHFASIASMSTMAGRSPFTQANTPLSSSCLPASPRAGRPNRPGSPLPCFQAATEPSRPRCLRSKGAHPAASRSCSRTGA